MKKLLTRAFLFIAAVAMTAITAGAQGMPIPVDKEVRIGKLPNGLTYYIRHNEKPKGQADFYIAQKVGSILEEDNQRGLAHFLEHMCFNGTTNFPGNSLISWLETVGVKFGRNLNAYTAVDETVYNISNVPTDRVEVQDSCLLILHDWANDLLLEDAEIDKERGVIHEEWRSRMVGNMRILENILPTLYPDSRYAYRLPIGTMEVVDNFPYQALRDYYEKWYRPDQQGIIVVGDIDVDRIEAKIKELFSDIEMPADAPERVYYPVPDTPGTIYAIGKDKEMTVPIIYFDIKSEAFPNEMKGDISYLVQNYAIQMICNMLNARLNEIEMQPDSPLAQHMVHSSDFLLSKTKEAFEIVAVAKSDVRPALETAYRELLRAARGGFTVGEYQRARDEYMSALERAYNNRNDRESGAYVNEYVRHFIDNEPIPSIEDEYQIMQMLSSQIPVEALNQIMPQIVTADNRVIYAMLPDKEGVPVPTEEELAAIIAKVDAEEIAPYVDEVKAEPLIPELPAPGSIVSEKALDQWGATEWTLSNGVKVIVKPTTFKQDEILFTATAKGGTSTLPSEADTDLKSLELVLESNGLGTYTNIDLQKYLQGKQVQVAVGIDNFERSLGGSTTPKDLQTLMELIYMSMTDIQITADEFSAMQNSYASIIERQESNPSFIFSRDVMKTLFASPRVQPVTPDEIRAANRENILNIIHNQLANAADFTFVFVGNVDLNTLRPLVEQYIATLPSDPANVAGEPVIDPAYEIRSGKINETFTTKMESPISYAFVAATGEKAYTSKDAKLASVVGQILSKRLLDTVREDMGAVYSISAQGSMSRTPGRNISLASQFPFKPELKQQVFDFIEAELGRMQSNVTEAELSKVIEYMVKEAKEGKENNRPWLSAIAGWLDNGVDSFNGNVETIQSITVADVQQFLADLMDQGNYAVVILDPEATEATNDTEASETTAE